VVKPVESLADRRKNRKNLIDQDNMNQFSSELDKLKQNAESILDRENKEGPIGGNLLEDISEEDIPEGELEEDRDLRYRKKSINLTAIKEKPGEEGASLAGGNEPK